MVIKEIKESITIIEGLDEVIESDVITTFDKYGNMVSQKDDVGNCVESVIEYYEQDGVDTPPVKSKTTIIHILNKLSDKTSTTYTKEGKKIEEKKLLFDGTSDKPIQEHTIIFNTDGICNYEKLKTIIDNKTGETFTIEAKLPSEVKHAKKLKDMENLWYFVDKNGLVTRSELYDNQGRLLKLEDYPDDRMYVYGYRGDTTKLLSCGIFSIIENRIVYIEENKFDDKDRIIFNETISYQDATQTQNWLTYDDNGDCVTHSENLIDLRGENPNPPKTTVTRCKYDENHHILESSTKEKTHKYEYSFYE